jgi:hypothetical protein
MRRIDIVAVAITLTVMTSSVAERSVPDVLHATASGTADWPEYEHDIAGSGYTTDTGISAQNASTLALRVGWPLRSASGTMITAQPIESGGYLYWGSWDGVEHGTPVNGGAGGWATSLGTLAYPATTACANSGVHGIGDSGVVANVTINGVAGPVVFVAGGGNDSAGGGSAKVYALDALTGAILWQTDIAPSPDDYLWSSPVFYQATGDSDPSIYEGVADVGEPCPLVRGEVVQLDALTGAIQNTFYTAPSGCTGATVWGSLTIDAGANVVYAVTGNRGSCTHSEPYSYAIVKLDATNLSVLDSWHVPKSEQVNTDDDFGSVPILFQRTVNGKIQPLVGAPNKNGIFYIWNRNDLAAGPVDRLAVANHNVADIAPAAFDGTVLYIGTPATTVNGVRQPGSIQAYNVDNLPTLLWETNLTAPVIASVTAAAGIVVVNAGHKTLIINASTGAIVKTLTAELVGGTRGFFWGASIIAGGVLYEGDTKGFVYAYSPGGQ